MLHKSEKIVLVAPYRTVQKSETVDYNALRMPWVPPLGLGYLSSFLKLHGYEPKILDCVYSHENVVEEDDKYIKVGLGRDRIREYFRDEKPQIVGISSNFTSFYMDALEIAAIAKEINPGIKVVVGGAHATVDHMNTIMDPNVDVVIRGEGEYTFLEYLENPGKTDIKSTVIKINGKIIENEPRPVIEDLDALPFPDYDSMNMGLYLGLNKKSFWDRLLNQRIGSVISSRGCLFNCIFCSTCKVFKKFRGRSAKNVVDEIELLINKYKAQEIAFQDDCFLASGKRVEEICREILSRRIKIRWSVSPGLNLCLADAELLKLMVKSGLYRANLPIETGSSRTLKFIRKPVELDKAKEVVAQCNKLGLWTGANFLIGFPYETKEDIEQTANFIYTSDVDAAAVLICQPLQGSDLFDIYKKEQLLTHMPQRGSTSGTTSYDTKYFKAKELNTMRREILTKFLNIRIRSFFTPRGFWIHIIKKINTPRKFNYFLGKSLRALSRYNILGIITKNASSPFFNESGKNTQRITERTTKCFEYAWKKFGRNEVERGWYKDSFSYVNLLPKELFKEGFRGLDVGCGSGADMLNIERKGIDMVGVDITDSVFIAKSNLLANNINPKIAKADVYNLPFKENSFDLVYSFGVMHHLPDPEKAFRELVKFAKNGASVIIYVYERFTERSWIEKIGLWVVTQIRKITSRMSPQVLYLFCLILSPFIWLLFSLPANLLSRLKVTKSLAERFPFRHTTNLFCIKADLFDRFSPPVENRYSKQEIEAWLGRASLDNIGIINYRGWVVWGRKR